jgi:hypothetical protein
MRNLVYGICIALVALGCSSGGEGGGVGGTGISRGSISGFGSIFVTGTEYDTSGSQILFERVPATAADLRLGMVVQVEGARAADGLSGTAERVVFDDEIEGPIAAISVLSADEIDATILGQRVRVERGLTRFDAPLSFDTLAPNDLVEVSGFRQGEGEILATFIEKKGVFTPGGTAAVELKGTVSGRAGTTFAIGSVTVSFSGTTTLVDLPGSGPQNGDFVEVEGTLQASGVVAAARIEREGELAGDRDDVELEGIVSGFASLASFRVDGQPVDASGVGVEFEPADPGFVANGARVEVEGALQGGVLVATKVELRGGEVRVAAEIASAGDVNPAAGTFVLLGIPFHIDASTQLGDDGDDLLSLADLVAGDFLEVRGIEDGAGGVLATEVARDDDGDSVRLRGRVEAIDATLPQRSITILGVAVPTDGDTEFDLPGVSNEDDFYAQVQLGDLLDAEDGADGNQTSIDVADAIESEDD